MNEPIPKFRTVDGAALMSLPLRPREIPALEVLAENPNDQARLMRCMMDAHC